MPCELKDFQTISDRISKSLQRNWQEFDQHLTSMSNQNNRKDLDFDHLIREKKDAISQSEEEEKKLKIKLRNLETRNQFENSQLNKLAQELLNSQHECQQMPDRITEKEQQKEKLVRENNLMKKRYEEKLLDQKAVFLRLEKIDQFSQALGLAIVRKDNSHVQFIFTQIKPTDPEKCYAITIAVKEDRYSITECQPSLQPDKLANLLHNLNGSNNFQLFIKNIRFLFQQLC